MGPELTPSWSIGDEREGRWARSVRMLGISWRLLGRTAALRAVAAASFAAYLVAAAALFGPVVWWWAETDSRWVLVAGSAVAAYPFLVVTIFFNVALLAAASACMDGHRLTVGQSFAVAVRRLPQIAGWALLAAGVGALLDALAEWVPVAGALAAWILGAAWSVATLFAVPVIVLEGAGARAAATTSARVFGRTWGESVVGFVSITACTMVLSVPGGILLCLGAMANGGAAAAAVLAAGGLLLAIALFGAVTVERLFGLVLYRFATEGEVHGGFTEHDLRRGTFFKDAKRRR